jgi:SSS family solute:Na+ symporter
MESTLVGWDWLVIAVYFGAIGGIAWWTSRRNTNTQEYFLAGRNIGFFAIGCSLLASNVGSEHIVGLAGQGATTGMAMAHWELHAWIIVLLAYFFVPFYYRSGVFTVPEFLEKRFDTRCRWVLSLVSLLAYILTKVSVTVYAGALVFQTLLPDAFGSPQGAFWAGALGTVVITGIYTVFGGMRAVVYTESLQTIVFLVGSSVVTFIGLSQLGGWNELRETLQPHAAQFAFWRPLSDPDFPWLGIMIASPIVGVWYWCTDQYIVQRTLIGKDLATARRGALFGGLLKIAPVFIFLVPGMIGFALHEKGLISMPLIPDGEKMVFNGDQVFPTLVTTLLPAGLRGLVVACLLAALMSSLASLFNSAATLFTVDIYEKIFPGRPEKHLVFVGRMATCVVVGLGVLWIPVMARVSGGGLYQYLQSVQGYLAPPITAVFLLGLGWGRINRQGALWGLSAGFLLGLTKLTIQAFFGVSKINEYPLLTAIGDFNFLYATGILFAVSMAITTGVSLIYPAPDKKKIQGLTYASVREVAADELKASWDLGNRILTTVILLLVASIYLYFSFWLR